MASGTFTILKKEGEARRGTFETVHGTIQTPVFMNVGTVAAIKGAVSTEDLERIGTQIYELGKTDSNRFGRISGVFPGRSS